MKDTDRIYTRGDGPTKAEAAELELHDWERETLANNDFLSGWWPADDDESPRAKRFRWYRGEISREESLDF